ncbi:hypothetical protein AJ78_00459 [Emergomyces pasteurianus Ep9510]|uniref:Uncharacterized protein n=1 Tax=Emergomyces pasteurianus Ep9510 TaxID=1447872 RepID=A0A1J9PUN6_9EURO|nr:hypothetical protein AJ78_00459 [Emergomyces pasteurianus Ep9510]
MPPAKPIINRRDLENCGMVYTEKSVSQDGHGDAPSSLPAHIEQFRKALLDFGGLVTDWSEHRFETEAEIYRDRGGIGDNKSLAPPASAYFHDSDPTSPLSAGIWRHMEHCMKIARNAEGLVTAHAPEHDWKHLLQDIFQGYGDIFPLAGEQQEKDILWDDTKKYTENCPKPDFTYGYTMNQNIPVALRSTDLVSNFSPEVLGELRSAGLIPSPRSNLHTWSKDKTTGLSRDQLVCFPWAVVELHPQQFSSTFGERYSYTQAANGALVALRLNAEVANWATGSYDFVLPVVAFTCVGAEIKVWLAYSEIKDNICLGHKMVCIWESNLCLGWGVIATCAIVKNMLLWASRVWKPTISGYISRIQQNKLSFSLDGHVTKAAILSSSASPFVFAANSTQLTFPDITKPPVLDLGGQQPSGQKGNKQDPTSKASILEFGAPQTPTPKGTDQTPASSEDVSPPKTFADKADGFIREEPEKGYQAVRHGRKFGLSKATYDKIRESKQKQEHSNPRPSHASTVEDAKTTKLPTTESDSNKEECPQASDVIAEGTNRNSRDSRQGGTQEANLGNPSQKTTSIEKDCKTPSHGLSSSFNSEGQNDSNSLFTKSPKMDEDREQKRSSGHKEDFEDFEDSPDEPELTIGSCPHYGPMVAEALQLLWGDELLGLKAVSKIIHEIQGLELLDVTWSVLELWVAQHKNVPSPCEGLEKIMREINSVLEFAVITPDQMWASDPFTWRLIDKALQTILKSSEPTLKNILVWAIECMDLLESLELCEILNLGDLSCLELKRMDREIIDLMIRPLDDDPSISPAGAAQAAE